MGRQHTTWISDETWEQMKRIPGESVSERFRNAVKFADPVEGMRLRSLERQHEQLVEALTLINNALAEEISDKEMLDQVAKHLDTVAWVWWK